MVIDVLDTVTRLDFPIRGLCFEENAVVPGPASNPYFHWKTASSPGPLVSDFVTHEKGFAYSSYGIHVGQIDRLTFFGSGPKIRGYFVDCRQGSETARQQVIVDFAPSHLRRLVIPHGVAHSFDNLAKIVTRDEPIWFVDRDNPDWNIDNDLVSVSRSTDPADFPLVRVNTIPLPAEGHYAMSRLQRELLVNPASYQARYPVTVDGERKYVLIRNSRWTDDETEIEELLAAHSKINGVALSKNRYSYTGRRSWTIVPSTSSCISDVLQVTPDHQSRQMLAHLRTDRLLTFLNQEGLKVVVEVIDLRAGSSTHGQVDTLRFKADPRIHLRIPRGVGYIIHNDAEVIVRSEGHLYVDANEPREDLPAFGTDSVVYSWESLTARTPNIKVPDIPCPDTFIQSLARVESATLSRSASRG